MESTEQQKNQEELCKALVETILSYYPKGAKTAEVFSVFLANIVGNLMWIMIEMAYQGKMDAESKYKLGCLIADAIKSMEYIKKPEE